MACLIAGMIGCGSGTQTPFFRPAALRRRDWRKVKAIIASREAFEAYVEQVLCPELRPGDLVIMDNLSSHKGARGHELVRAAGAEFRYLPPYSPDFSPIEKAFAKLKALLRKAAQRTVEGLWTAIGDMLSAFRPHECQNCFAATGYDAH